MHEVAAVELDGRAARRPVLAGAGQPPLDDVLGSFGVAVGLPLHPDLVAPVGVEHRQLLDGLSRRGKRQADEHPKSSDQGASVAKRALQSGTIRWGAVEM